jgi:aminoglycoside/choline kinase family phosphotransferase
MDNRNKQIKQWLTNSLNFDQYDIKALAGDASFRRYFRVKTKDKNFILMDAPPARECCKSFIRVDNFLLDNQIPVPQIYQEDLTQGFLLLEDFGDDVLLGLLNPNNADNYYHKAIDIVCKMQTAKWQDVSELRAFDAAYILQDLMLLKEWFIEQLLEIQLSSQQEQIITYVFNELIAQITALPYAFTHRDYHSRNLMRLTDDSLGVLDFQDAMYGPVTYDLVSLLKDAYITWPRAKQESWLNYYYNKAQSLNLLNGMDQAQLYYAYDITGLQRHIKIIGNFARLCKRDGKDGYLRDIPRVMHYVIDVLMRLDIMHEFLHLMKDQLLPAFEQLNVTQD